MLFNNPRLDQVIVTTIDYQDVVVVTCLWLNRPYFSSRAAHVISSADFDVLDCNAVTGNLYNQFCREEGFRVALDKEGHLIRRGLRLLVHWRNPFLGMRNCSGR